MALWNQFSRVTAGWLIFCRGVAEGRFPDLKDRNNLWAILMTIADRKASNANRDAMAGIRGGGEVRGESVFGKGGDTSGDGLDGLAGSEPSPTYAAEVAEEFDVRMRSLPDELSQIAILKLDGYTTTEIAKKLNISPPIVRSRLEKIRKLWDAE